MTTLADLVPGQAFILVARATALDPQAGMTLGFYGPSGAQQGEMLISPAGVFSGQLQVPASQVPVTLVPAFAAVTEGDILASDASGETYVARAVWIAADGSYRWSASLSRQVAYTTAGWTVTGHVTL